jgi:catalase
LVGPRIGGIATAAGDRIQASASMENEPAFLFDGLVLPAGAGAVEVLAKHPFTMAFIKDHYLHGKAVLALGESESLIESAELPRQLPNGEPDPGLIVGGKTADAAKTFIKALAQRYPERIEPPALA